jgi:hypothetical protein
MQSPYDERLRYNMVEQVLNKEQLQRVLVQMENVARTPVDDTRRRGLEEPDPPSRAESEALLEDIAAAIRYASPDDEDRRSGEVGPASKADRTVYIPGSQQDGHAQGYCPWMLGRSTARSL